jgi:hypothetical protein
MSKHQFIGRLGIDDLKGIFAFVGNSQGDTSGSNEISDYIASKGWMSFVFDCNPNDQEAIYKEARERAVANTKYIDELQKEGRYGEEYTIDVELMDYPLFDDTYPKNQPIESYEYKILDFSKNK